MRKTKALEGRPPAQLHRSKLVSFHPALPMGSQIFFQSFSLQKIGFPFSPFIHNSLPGKDVLQERQMEGLGAWLKW
jgi:hypothetical protein